METRNETNETLAQTLAHTQALETTLALIKENDQLSVAQSLLGALDTRHPGLIKLWASLQARAGDPDIAPVVLRSVNEFLEQVGTPPQMLIEGHLPDKSLFILAGKPKHCKSFVALSVALEIVRAQKAFGQYAVSRTGTVVYLAMEDGEYEVANRLLKHQIPGEDLPLHFCTEGFRIATEASVEALAKRLRPLNPVLLVIDTATEALGIRRWEDRGEVSEKLRPLRELIARQICSVILVAHNRKAEGESGDEIAGSNAFTGAVDGWWSIYKKEVQTSGNVLLYYRREGRGGVKGEGVLEMDTHTLKVVAIESADAEARHAVISPSKPEAAKRAILQLLEDGKARNSEFIIEALKEQGIGENAARKAIGELKGTEIEETKQGREFYYSLSPAREGIDDDDDGVSLEKDHHHHQSLNPLSPNPLSLLEFDPYAPDLEVREPNHNLDAFA